jgi:beta-glucosidase
MEKMLYKDQTVSLDLRVDDLLSRMNLDEKIAQMVGVWVEKYDRLLTTVGNFDSEKASDYYPFGIGHIGRPSESAKNNAQPGRNARECVHLTNTIQRFFIEKTRLGIPVIFHEECLHGMMAREATNYPVPIALASTWDTNLVEMLFSHIAEETRSRGGHQVFAPVLDIARDPRWGRFEETFGEDPFLTAKMGIAAVKGLQGNCGQGIIDQKHVGVTIKHFAGHGHPESGTNIAPAHYAERELREIVLYPFKKCIEEAFPVGVMPSYNEIDGIPLHANKWLLDTVLRKEWGFDGVIVSDYYAIQQLFERHKIASGYSEAALISLRAGVDIELPDPNCFRSIKALLEKGEITIEQINQSVKRLLLCKFRLGLFDQPYTNETLVVNTTLMIDRNAEMAFNAAKKSLILLKNQKNILPLNASEVKTLGVIGPNADKVLLGGYSDTPLHAITLLEGIRKRVGDTVDILYSEGCRITESGSWFRDEVILPDPEEELIRLEEAVSVANKCDIIILAVGENEQICREAWSENHPGDTASLDLIGNQNELVKRIGSLGKPVIAVLFHGRPLAITSLNDRADAIIDCWYSGQEWGRAIAGALFGDYSPSGKLTVSVPRSVGHLPVFYNYKPSARRGYIFNDISPLYHFGFGLSYTSFQFGTPELSKKVICANEEVILTITITNTGTIAGDEIVQLYIRDCISSVTRPVKELKGFQRISLSSGESKTVSFKINYESLAFYDSEMKYVVEPGEFEIMVGNSSRNEDLQKLILIVV